MRHYPQRHSRLAYWSRRVAIFAAAVLVAGVLLSRTSMVQPTQGLSIVAAALALAGVAVLLAIAGYIDIWRSGATGLTRANFGLVLGVALLAYPSWFVIRAYQLPPINDISTDLRDPPAFSRSRTALEARGGHVPSESSPNVRELQRKAYPETVPIVLELGPEETYQLVLQAAQQLKWRIVDRAPPSVRSGNGRVDAVDRTTLMRFTDDIAIRIRPLANQTRVDIRSVSRSGQHDFGANAARIRAFSDALIDLNKGA